MASPEKATLASNGTVFLVRGKNAGRPIWHYVLVDRLKFALFRQALKQGQLDVVKYGKILCSGWGKNPPAETVKQVEDTW